MSKDYSDNTGKINKFLILLGICLLCIGTVVGLVYLVQWFTS